MSKNLGLSNDYLSLSGAIHTGKEISNQPDLWLKLWESTSEIVINLQKYLMEVYSEENLNIILTGAGTSSFIGDVLEGPFQTNTGIITKAVASTDLVTHPELHFFKDKPVLLISFARSGSSPESTKVIELAEILSKKVFHIIVTCNRESDLIKSVSDKKNFIYLMPPEADDQSLAMTGSFTSMLLAGLFLSRIFRFNETEDQVRRIASYGKKILNEYTAKLKTIAELSFERAVFLGSGILRGIARESHLKLQELTDGKIICKHDTFLGFRHGPKAVVDEKTLIVYLFSNNDYVNKYEFDLVDALKAGRKNLLTIGVMERDLNIELDQKIIFSVDENYINEDFLTIVMVLPAQILAFFKSLNLGLKPDSPSDSGMIHRVVQGVKTYTYKNGNH